MEEDSKLVQFILKVCFDIFESIFGFVFSQHLYENELNTAPLPVKLKSSLELTYDYMVFPRIFQ